ncbi:MAG: long-chain fatty acid--CoA ligase, partial [Sphingobacteriales bacterium]
MTSSTSGTTFISNLAAYGSAPALIWHNVTYTYEELLTNITHWRTQLAHIPAGSIVILESDFSPHTIAILLVLIERNTIVVPLDISHQDKNIAKAEIAQPDYRIKVISEDQIEVSAVADYPEKNDLYHTVQERQTPGLVLFTSGSSGKPKGALHDFAKLLSKFEVRRKALRTVNFLLFDHWGGLNTLFHILSNGGTVVILENRSPNYVCEMIAKHQVALLPTSPTFLNMLVMSRAYDRHDLSSLSVISYGAEPMPASLLEHL